MTFLLAQLVIRSSAFLPAQSRLRWWLIDPPARFAHWRLA